MASTTPCSVGKEELIDRLRARTGLSKADATKALTGLIEEISDALGSGECVRLVGFGVFESAFRKGRTGFNPKTKEPIEVAAKRVPVFRAGIPLKEKVASL